MWKFSLSNCLFSIFSPYKKNERPSLIQFIHNKYGRDKESGKDFQTIVGACNPLPHRHFFILCKLSRGNTLDKVRNQVSATSVFFFLFIYLFRTEAFHRLIEVVSEKLFICKRANPSESKKLTVTQYPKMQKNQFV